MKNFKKITIISFFMFSIMSPSMTFAEKEYKNIQFKDAYDLQKDYNLDGKGVSIAILDTGIDLNNKDLKIKKGVTFINENEKYQDLNGHGTYITSVVSSQKNGIAPKASIYAVKVLDRNQRGDYDSIIRGINWSIEQNVDIILMSLGGRTYSKELDKVIKKASKKGITIVSAVGNGGLSTQDTITYPAKLEGVIGIGATNNKNERWFKSSRGEGIDVMAPGENIYGTTLDNKTVKQSGTSVAAAYTTGVIALLKQHDTDISNVEIEKILKETASSLGSKYEYGSGIMNEKEFLMYNENKSVFHKLFDFFK